MVVAGDRRAAEHAEVVNIDINTSVHIPGQYTVVCTFHTVVSAYLRLLQPSILSLIWQGRIPLVIAK